MTEGDARQSGFKPGDVANGHILTAAGWMPLRGRPPGMPGPYYAGDVIGDKAFTGSEWVPLNPTPEMSQRTPRTPGLGGAVAERPVPASAVESPALALTTASRGWLVWVGIGVAVLLALGILSAVVANNANDGRGVKAKNGSPAATPTAAATPEASEAPAASPSPTAVKPDPEAAYAAKMKRRGWMQLADDLWGRWDPNEADQFSVRFNLRVISPKGCPSGVYVEANVRDSSKTIVGFTNDVLPSLPANQEAVMELMSMADGEISIQMTEATCR